MKVCEKKINEVLNRSKRIFEKFKSPEVKLKELLDLYHDGNFSNADELNSFCQNALDHIVEFEEEKWSLAMIGSAALVFLFGLVQIAVGVMIELYSVGFMTHVGAGFISEGINDLFYASNSFITGHFDWRTYALEKLKSIALTAVTISVGAYFSRGAKVSRFGNKIAAPTVENCTGKVCEKAGKELIELGGKQLTGLVIRRIAKKCVEGVAFGIVNHGFDALLESYIQKTCQAISLQVLREVAGILRKWFGTSKVIREAFETMGEDEAKRKIEKHVETMFSKENELQSFAGFAARLGGSFAKGIGEAMKKQQQAGVENDIQKAMKRVNQVCRCIDLAHKALSIYEVIRATDKTLNELESKFKEN